MRYCRTSQSPWRSTEPATGTLQRRGRRRLRRAAHTLATDWAACFEDGIYSLLLPYVRRKVNSRVPLAVRTWPLTGTKLSSTVPSRGIHSALSRSKEQGWGRDRARARADAGRCAFVPGTARQERG